MLRARSNVTGKVRGGGRGANGRAGGVQIAQTWDPLRITTPSTTLSNGDLTGTITASPRWLFSTGSKALQSGKWYFEIQWTGGAGDPFHYLGVCVTGTASNGGVPTDSCMQRGNGASATGTGTAGSAWADGDILGFAVDMTVAAQITITVYKNNVANGDASRSALTGPNYTIAHAFTSGTLTRALTIRTTSSECTYSPPSGYLHWGTV